MLPQNAVNRRLHVLIRILKNPQWNVTKTNVRAYVSEGSVSIGGVTKEIKPAKNPEYVPRKYYNEKVNQNTLHHLRWMMQKDLLGQDVFLIGPPGSKKRNLAMQYIELTNREHEYVALSRDTTESDLKQRREIISGTATYFDQSAVKAATEGRILVLEGIEKAERNVLPVLNNLLENREMHLEDGRLLIPSTRYDKLLKDFSKEELDKWKLVRVDENFRVIALGLPVPKYRGNPLDPPLRSRFQARDVHNDSYQRTGSLNVFIKSVDVCDKHKNYPIKFWVDIKTTKKNTQIIQGNITLPIQIGDNTSSNCTIQIFQNGKYNHLFSVIDKNFCLALNKYLGEFWYDIERYVNLIPVGKCPIPKEWLEELRSLAPTVSLNKLELLLSAAFGLLSKESNSLGLPNFPVDNLPLAALILEQNQNLSPFNILYRLYPYRLFLKDGIKPLESLLTRLGVNPEQEYHEMFTDQSQKISDDYIATNYQNNLIEEMYQTAKVSDLCIIGPKGCGKNLLVSKVAEKLNSDIENVILYQDMTSRDLLQQRTTLDNGDTIWKFSPLVEAALEGKIVIIDGIHRIHPSTLSVLHRLVHNREIQLYDGKRLINEDRYKFLQDHFNLNEEQLTNKGVLKINPKFRIIAIGEPPSLHSVLGNWLSPEVLSLFVFHEMRSLKKDEEIHVITQKHGPISKPFHQIINLASVLRNSEDLTLKNLSGHLSTRQLMRIAARLKLYPTDDAYAIIQDTFMMQFLPPLARQALENVLTKLKIQPLSTSTEDSKIKYEIKDNMVTIGKTSSPVYRTESLTKVPSVLFYDVPQHLVLMEKLLQDFHLKEHLLIVGNQGVGKNKIVDRFLELLNRPREYIQLHRDTTVQTLTIQPTVKDGLLIHEDSPLVKAIKYGHVLVIDEADKAPTHVTCILKSLVESGQMVLSDGRRIVKNLPKDIKNADKYICMHPDFRMIVLANRPGFPFLGNDFFGALGDLFSSHAVDNPSEESEINLLRQYGPEVPIDTIKKLVEVFGELRLMADQGLVNYPYSTREVVNIVKHLQLFPNADIEDVIFNVFDFDRYSPEIVEILGQVLSKHGFSDKNVFSSEYIMKKRSKENLQVTVDRYSGLDTTAPKHGKEDPNNDPHVGGNTWAGGTGGRDTAGLGGKGGPYRLDKGHKVHQLSDEEKAAVPEHIQKAAREMGKKAFQERLREIGMSGYDATLYEQFSTAVSRQVQSLRGILGSLEAKNKERYWTRHQTTGELDDVKLIDGLLGEKTIFRRRTEQIPELGTPQLKPKLLRLVVDVSGSMYRFNSYDGRLDRELEAVVLVMEAFEGFQDKILYDIKGHSGDTHDIEFVNRKNPPKNNKERLDVVRLMHAHSQYCWSGDHTLPATELAISSLAKEECDEAIVVVLSDANLQRYGIPPSTFGKILTSCPNVNAYAIFLGGLGNQAEKLTEQLPAGRAFVCIDLDNLPQILKQIFSSSVINV